MVANLIVIDMLDFDVILDINFLSRDRAKIKCRKKKVWFNLDNGEQFTFREGYSLPLLL